MNVCAVACVYGCACVRVWVCGVRACMAGVHARTSFVCVRACVRARVCVYVCVYTHC